MPLWRRLLVSACFAVIFISAVRVSLNRWPTRGTRAAQLQEFETLENRMLPLRMQLPPGTFVGYVSEFAPWSYEWMLGYFKTQFALAPRVVDYENHPSLWIANFHDQRSLETWLFQNQNDIARTVDLGNGLALVEFRFE